MQDLEKKLKNEMLQSIEIVKAKTKYNPTYCRNAINNNESIISFLQNLLKPNKPTQDGFCRVVKESCFHKENLMIYSIEYIILKPDYKDLPLENERKEAKRRLETLKDKPLFKSLFLPA